MNSNNLTEYPENYLVVSAKIGNKEVKALIDTGAQPTVIKRSCVPIGTIITKGSLTIKGVHGPTVKVSGTADVHIEIGHCIFTKNCIVVEDNAIDFPAGTSIIMGANFLPTITLTYPLVSGQSCKMMKFFNI